MSTIVDDLTAGLAARIRIERKARGWSLDDLAKRSGVSKAMISKVERGAASPTAVLLGRLSGAFSLTLSTLLARAEDPGRNLVRAADQPRWRDPQSGYLRRQVSPPADPPFDIIQVELPAGASVAFPAASFAFIRQLVWVLDGRLTFIEGETEHDVRAGDCLRLGAPADCIFRNGGRRTCCYVVVVVRR